MQVSPHKSAWFSALFSNVWHKYNKIGLFTSFIMKITTKIGYIYLRMKTTL